MDLVADILIFHEPQLWYSSLKGTRDVHGGPDLSGFRDNAGGATFCQTEVLAEGIVPLLIPPLPSMQV